MYYRRKDSRMGDEIFAMGILLAPFVWKLVKKGQTVIIAKKEKFDALPLEEQSRKKFKMFSIGEVIFKVLICMRIVLALIYLFNGSFVFGDITSIIGCVLFCIFMKIGKKKYEDQATTTIG